MVSDTKHIVHVKLLDEITDVWRPAPAVKISDGIYQLLPSSDYDPVDESWEFAPDSIVRVIEKTDEDGTYLVALEKIR